MDGFVQGEEFGGVSLAAHRVHGGGTLACSLSFVADTGVEVDGLVIVDLTEIGLH